MLLSESKRNVWHNYIELYDISKEMIKQRICVVCNKLIDRLKAIKKWVYIYSLLELDIKEIRKIARVCKLWWYASNYYLSIFREIQYKLPIEEYSDMEKRMLYRNVQYYRGHSKYVSALAQICCDDTIQILKEALRPKKTPCHIMMCTRNCTSRPTSIDAINLLARCYRQKIKNKKIIQLVLKYLQCSDTEFKCYLPFLVYYADDILQDYIINRCLDSVSLMNSLYWEVQLKREIDASYIQLSDTKYHSNIYSQHKNKIFLKKIIQTLSQSKYTDMYISIIEGDTFIRVIQKLGEDIYKKGNKDHNKKQQKEINMKHTYPIDEKKKIIKIYANKIISKNSISKPIIIPCLTDKNKVTKLMYKIDNLRNDQIVLNIIKLMEVLVKREEGIDLNIITYNILPLSGNSGIIEIVDNAETLYYIKEKLKTNILNFIMEDNENMTIKNLRETFIKSVAAYCVITYLLGVGDRHLDNIMLSKEGKLFHIDFGYILGKDTIFNNASIRLTPGILHALGGYTSKHYKNFKKICGKIFNCLRRNINIFMNMLLILPHISDINLTERQIIEQVYKRFIPGENDTNAELYITHKLEEHHISYKIKDFCHYHSQERTFGGVMDKVKSVFSGIWSSFNHPKTG
jgi:phosphatidylinositol 3-kinase